MGPKRSLIEWSQLPEAGMTKDEVRRAMRLDKLTEVRWQQRAAVVS
jgi:hypothetical protein